MEPLKLFPHLAYCSNKIRTLWTLELNTKHTVTHSTAAASRHSSPSLTTDTLWSLSFLIGQVCRRVRQVKTPSASYRGVHWNPMCQPTWQERSWELVLSGSRMRGSTPECITMISILSGRSQMDVVTVMVVVTLTYFTKSCSVSGLGPTPGYFKGVLQMCHWDSQRFFCLGLLRCCRKIL